MDGLELCRRIKDDATLNRTYIVIVTSKERREDMNSALESGADDFLKKPWDNAELLARVRAGIRIEELERCLAMRNEDFGRVTERLNQEMQVVSDIQKAMLPLDIPQVSALDFTAYYLPSSESGGDYYDVVQLDEHHLGIVIADVSGHGAPAMVTMALIRLNFHHIVDRFHEPHLLLEEMNRLLYDDLPTDQFATMFYAMVDTRDMSCRYASAGHNPPIRYHAASGETKTIQHCEGFPLKLVTRDATYATKTMQFEAGDRLVLYTDGIPESFNAERADYGMKRFTDVVRRSGAKGSLTRLKNEIVADVMAFCDGQLPEDDLTLAIGGFNDSTGARRE